MNTNDLNKAYELGKHLTILRLKNVKNRTGISRSSIYLKVSEGTFPRQVSLGARSVGWLESDINDWIAGRVQVTGTPVAGGHHD